MPQVWVIEGYGGLWVVQLTKLKHNIFCETYRLAYASWMVSDSRTGATPGPNLTMSDVRCTLSSLSDKARKLWRSDMRDCMESLVLFQIPCLFYPPFTFTFDWLLDFLFLTTTCWVWYLCNALIPNYTSTGLGALAFTNTFIVSFGPLTAFGSALSTGKVSSPSVMPSISLVVRSLFCLLAWHVESSPTSIW